MKLVKPSATILQPELLEDALQRIEAAGRTCYKSEKNITAESAHSFVSHIVERGHLSVVEHVGMTVRFVIDRGISHELVRHRLCSFSQESTRYCDYEGGHIQFVIPPWTTIQPGTFDDFHYPYRVVYGEDDLLWMDSMKMAENQYKALRNAGWKPEKARSVLPNSLKTEIVTTANMREWMHIFHLRTALVAHPQIREVMRPLCEEVRSMVPVLFDQIEWETEQIIKDQERRGIR